MSQEPQTNFEVNVSKDTFKFNAAHFVAYNGFRERLHGHNYKLSIRLLGSRTLGQDGYVLDFGELKAVAKKVCKELNEYFICPMYSNVITIQEDETQGGGGGQQQQQQQPNWKLLCQDGAQFSFPKSDVVMLPIVHSTVEEIAIYCWGQILIGLDAKYLIQRGIHTMEVTCAEAVGQEAVFRMKIPDTNDKQEILNLCNVQSYVPKGDVVPRSCLPNVMMQQQLKKDDATCPSSSSSNTTPTSPTTQPSCPHCGI